MTILLRGDVVNKFWTVSLMLAFLFTAGLLLESQQQVYARQPEGAVYTQVLPRKGEIYSTEDSGKLVIDDMVYRLSSDTKVLDSEGKELDVSALQKGDFVEFLSVNELISKITILPSGLDTPTPVTRPAVPEQGEVILQDGVWRN